MTSGPARGSSGEHLDAFSEEGLREWAADAISESVDDNNATLDHKAENLKWALRAFIFESFLVAIVAISIPF